MGKLKTHKGVAKRFKLTKSGKLKYAAGGRGHLLTGKKSKRKRALRRLRIVKRTGQSKQVKQLLPYG